MNWLYALFGHAVDFGIAIASLYTPKLKRIRLGRQETISRITHSLDPKKETIWFHASSLGEFEQGKPLVEYFRNSHPQYQILISFFSPSGYEVCSNYRGADCVVYLPGDTPKAVEHFLDSIRLKMAVFIKYDFWPVMLSSLSSRGIPTYLVSAIFRPSQLFFKPWGGLYRRLLYFFDHIFVQDEASLNLLHAYGITAASEAGDTRFDRVERIAQSPQSVAIIEAMKADGTPLIIAGSTWREDEDILLAYLQERPRLRLVIAPHENIEHTTAYLRSKLGKGLICLSEVPSERFEKKLPRCLVIDRFGLLSSLYRYADVAYIGGGFGKSIHNTIEAAVYGVPVVFGRAYHKFREAKLLIANGGGFGLDEPQEVAPLLDKLLSDTDLRARAGRAARSVVEHELGAVERIIQRMNLEY